MNVFIRFGNWLARAPLSARIEAMEQGAAIKDAEIKALTNKVKEMAAALAKIEMFVGFRRIGQSKEDIRQVIDNWNGLQ